MSRRADFGRDFANRSHRISTAAPCDPDPTSVGRSAAACHFDHLFIATAFFEDRLWCKSIAPKCHSGSWLANSVFILIYVRVWRLRWCAGPLSPPRACGSCVSTRVGNLSCWLDIRKGSCKASRRCDLKGAGWVQEAISGSSGDSGSMNVRPASPFFHQASRATRRRPSGVRTWTSLSASMNGTPDRPSPPVETSRA